jgi:hypothetical protein
MLIYAVKDPWLMRTGELPHPQYSDFPAFFPAPDGVDFSLNSCNLVAREKPAGMEGLFYQI